MDFRDDLGRAVTLAATPQRVISLCPSQTETLFALGLADQIVGLTRYCVHPSAAETPPPNPLEFFPSPLRGGAGEGVESKTKIGGTKQLDLSAIERLAPDLIIAEKEENRREDVERLAERWPVFVTDVGDFESALKMIETLGRLCDRAQPAQALARQIAVRWKRLQPVEQQPGVLYLIWRKPFMAAGAETYIDSVLSRCGMHNVVSTSRYPELNARDLQDLKPELVLLSSEPYPFHGEHLVELQAFLPQARIELVDGEMFSWYGVRMLRAADYLQEFIERLAA